MRTSRQVLEQLPRLQHGDPVLRASIAEEPMDRPLTVRGGEPEANVHVLASLEILGGSFIPKCACGVVGLPCDRRMDAERWTCPVGEGESFAAVAQRVYDRLLADAQLGGCVR